MGWATFKKLKPTYTKAPILKHPNPEKSIVVEMDAPETGLGAVLSKVEGKHFINGLSSPENYHLLSKIMTLPQRAFSCQARNVRVVPLTGGGHSSIINDIYGLHNLEYLRLAKQPNPVKPGGPFSFLSHFHFTLSYRSGNKNTKVDSLLHF